MRFVWAGATHVGHVREGNEDAMYPDTSGASEGPLIVAVADGMGGHVAGEVASRLAIQTAATPPPSSKPIRERIREANEAVLTEARRDPSKAGMGTTLTLAEIHPDGHVVIGHVGDSRAYRLRDGVLVQLTQDHTMAAEMVARGRLHPDRAETHPHRHMLTRALGTGAVTPDVVELDVKPGDRLLLCSDGLTGMVDTEDISRILRRADSPDEAAWQLVEAANAAGGLDNTTVIVVDVLP